MNRSLYCVAGHGVDLDLRRQVRAGVHLAVHVERRELGVSQVAGAVGVEHAARDRRLVAAAGEDALPLLPHDDRRAGVLAGRQHTARRDARVLEELERDEPVVGRGLRIPEDVAPAAGGVRGGRGGRCRASPPRSGAVRAAGSTSRNVRRPAVLERHAIPRQRVDRASHPHPAATDPGTRTRPWRPPGAAPAADRWPTQSIDDPGPACEAAALELRRRAHGSMTPAEGEPRSSPADATTPA